VRGGRQAGGAAADDGDGKRGRGLHGLPFVIRRLTNDWRKKRERR
jgi:hypothetical protein